jgi:CRISPR-associated endoribonuclease Cas6
MTQPTTTQTLYSTVVKLTPLAHGTIPATQGRLAHGAFLDLIRSVDPALSEVLHQKNQRRPFTVSPLQGLRRAQKGQVRVRAGEELWLRFTLLNSDLFTTLTRYLLTNTPYAAGPRNAQSPYPSLRLGEITFAITELLTTPGSHAWAGYTPVAGLGEKWQTTPPDRLDRKIGLELASGTMFSRSSNKNGMGKFLELLPTPEMVFGSLAAMWNDHTGLELDKQALRDYAAETVVVSRFDIKTRLFYYWGNPQIGAVGRITYELKDKHDQAMIRTLNMLADFAFYSGLGAKTTMGMGMVRRTK